MALPLRQFERIVTNSWCLASLTLLSQADKSYRSFERNLRRSLVPVASMPDETKSPSPPPPEDEPKPTADQPATPGGVKSTPSGSVQSETKTTPQAFSSRQKHQLRKAPLPLLPRPARYSRAANRPLPAAAGQRPPDIQLRRSRGTGSDALGFADGGEVQAALRLGNRTR